MTPAPRSRRLAFLLFAASLTATAWASSVQPGPMDPLVGQMVARILEQNHYNHHELNDKTSRENLRNYLESYDYNHMFFEKSDVDEFEAKWAKNLDDKLKEGDVQPAYDIFDRFLKRLEEKDAYIQKLAASTFTFEANESLFLDRHESPWPTTPQESRELWRKRIKYEVLQERLAKTKPEEQVKTVVLRYDRLLRSYKEYDASDVLQAYLTSLTHTFDPHSDYMAAPQKDNFDISMKLSLVGIGAVLRSEDGYAKIVSLVPGGPADSSKKLHPNDRIEAIAQGEASFMEAVGMKLDRLVQLIRGEKGTTVRLRIIPADAIDPSTRVTVAIVRDEIKLTDQEAKAKIIDVKDAAGRAVKVGVIDLPSFYADMKSVFEPKSTTRDVEKLIAYLKKQGIEGLVIDLRRNGGGSLSEAVSMTGLFIPEGPVVQVKDNHGLIKILRDGDPSTAYDGPLLVLTSRASASASEIFAAALQDYGRALVVGEKSTFGKGTVQSIVDLGQYLPGAMHAYKPGAVKLTIQKFYRISGGSTQHRGVTPDVHLPSIDDSLDITETSLKNALPYDEVEPAPFPRVGAVTSGEVKELQRASSQRVASSLEFGFVREDIARYKQQKEHKEVSLNEKKRLDEKAEDDAREQARKKARAAAKAKPLTATDVTLEAIDKGLPIVASTVPVTTPPEEGAEYEKAPPTPDFVLEEGVHVLADLVDMNAATTGTGAAIPSIPGANIP